MKGDYQHCAKRHLNRYAAEFEFRHNNLPEDEAAGWRAEFAAELDRFGVAEAA